MNRREFIVSLSTLGIMAKECLSESSSALKEEALQNNPLSFNLEPIDESVNQVPVQGISEWMCYYANYGIDIPDDEVKVIDECIDAHLALGIDQMIWNCGRSVVSYWSELPNTTRMCELDDTVGENSSRLAVQW